MENAIGAKPGRPKRNLLNNVKKYRMCKRLRQVDFEKATGISIGDIRMIEVQRITTSPKNMKRLINFFGVSYDQMFYKAKLTSLSNKPVDFFNWSDNDSIEFDDTDLSDIVLENDLTF